MPRYGNILVKWRNRHEAIELEMLELYHGFCNALCFFTAYAILGGIISSVNLKEYRQGSS